MTTLKYPIETANGDLVLNSDSTADAIVSAIRTRFGERVFRNTYGSDIDVFVTTDDLTALLIELEESIIASTLEYRPLTFELQGSLSDLGVVDIQIDYDDGNQQNTLNVSL